jgi:hypothetical protein
VPQHISLGVTATREGMTHAQKVNFRKIARGYYGYFHEGDAVGGDAESAEIIDEIGGYVIFIHPPANPKYRAYYKPKTSTFVRYKPKPYGDRDLDIVIASDIMVACPKQSQEPSNKRGSGTWLTIGYARANLKPLIILWADGSITEERMEG